MTLSPRERVIRQIKHQETDILPYTIRFGSDIGEQIEGYGTDVAERLDVHYGGPAWRKWIDNAIVRVLTPELSVDTAKGPIFTDVFGSRWRVDRRPFYLVEPVLKAPSLKGFSFPDVQTLLDDAWERRTLKAIEEAGDHFVVAGFAFGLWERTWTLRGFEDALADAAGEPAFFEELLDCIAEHQMAIIERLVRLPVDGVMFSDDWGYQRGLLLGPERWRSLLKPRLARMYARVHSAGKYTLSHCCGSVADVLPDIIEAGLDVLESVQPEAEKMDPYELKRSFGDRITFWGGIGSQSLIPLGTPDEIRAEIAKLCREMGRGGGYILAPAKPFQRRRIVDPAQATPEHLSNAAQHRQLTLAGGHDFAPTEDESGCGVGRSHALLLGQPASGRKLCLTGRFP